MYEKYYGLAAKPFKLAPDPRFFYASSSHKRAMAYLLYGVKQGEGFIVITGDVGTGKTTLVNNLLRVLQKEDIAVAQIVTSQLEADDLLQIVAATFGLPYENVSKAVVLKNLEAYFIACYREGRRVLLVVDEAQNLPPRAIEELRMLSNFQIDGQMLLQSFLLGQKEFRVTMRSRGFEQLRQRVIAAYHLKPLEPGETRAYITHRLHTVGWKNNPIITEDGFEAIHAATKGVPRRINLFCDRVFLFSYLEEKHEIDGATVKEVAKDIADEEYVDEDMEAGGVDTRHQPAGSGSSTAGKGGGKDPDSRLSRVEDSVSSLESNIREELSALRRALLDNANSSKDRH